MTTLQTQFKNYISENPNSNLSYNEWMEQILTPIITDYFKTQFEILKLQEINESKYEVLLNSNSKLVGYFIQQIDGYFHFSLPDPNSEVWSDYVLLELGSKLKELNKPWDDYLQKKFKNEEEE
jgi:hypothetical protein